MLVLVKEVETEVVEIQSHVIQKYKQYLHKLQEFAFASPCRVPQPVAGPELWLAAQAGWRGDLSSS